MKSERYKESKEEAQCVMLVIHEGVYANHKGGKALIGNIMREGYYGHVL